MHSLRDTLNDVPAWNVPDRLARAFAFLPTTTQEVTCSRHGLFGCTSYFPNDYLELMEITSFISLGLLPHPPATLSGHNSHPSQPARETWLRPHVSPAPVYDHYHGP